MASEIIMPRVGQSVESCVIVKWKISEGDSVKVGDPICDVETDKAVFEVESTAEGTVLGIFYPEDSDVPVLNIIAAVGEPGEDIEDLRPKEEAEEEVVEEAAPVQEVVQATAVAATAPAGEFVGISPRAKNLAIEKGIDFSILAGSGPEGRIIERDILAAAAGNPPLSPAAKARMAQGGLAAPAFGSGIGGRVLSTDLIPSDMVSNVGGNDFVNIRVLASDIAALIPQPPAPEVKETVVEAPSVTAKPEKVDIPESQGKYKEIAVKGVRKVVAERMHSSLLTTSQLTLNASADASAILAYRKECKANPEKTGITINDSVMFSIVETIKEFKELNAYMLADKIIEFEGIHLGFAVDTPRGLMVPVIKNADKMTIEEMSIEAKRLGKACQDGTIDPDDLTGGTFTVTNLGAAGIESFTPVLNAPQVAILGVCAVQLKPVMDGDDVKFVPHMGLSLTFDHCAVDGAPGARFLVALKEKLAKFAK